MDIDIDHFAQLRLLAWNRAPASVITGEDALALYERNWRFIDQGTLTAQERDLIERLVKEFGNGVLHV